MNILYITSSFEDYLQDVTFIGLRNLFGSSVVDFPKKDVLYSNCSKDASELYGCGFTVWKTPKRFVARSFASAKDTV